MIGAPLALLGLLAIVVPVLIHLLGRHQSRVQRFPTLRFIPASRLAPTRRRRISDWPLLLVRCAIVAAAALALSQPYFDFGGRTPQTQSGVIHRAIVVDTSLSMQRLAGTTRAVDSARALATTATTSAITTTIETDDLRHGIRGALAWLDDRPGSRELMVVSDFAGGTVGSWDGGLANADASVGITLVRLPARGVVARTASERPAAFLGAADSAGASAAWRAAGWTLAPAAPGRIANVIYRNAPERADLMARAAKVTAAWPASVVTELRRHPTLREASVGVPVESTPLDTVAGDITAGQVGEQLVLFINADAGSLTSAALTSALAQILDPPMGAELDTSSVPAAAIARLNRPAAPPTNAPTDSSDGRWLWALVLALIIVETIMRRRSGRTEPARATTDAAVEERAA